MVHPGTRLVSSLIDDYDDDDNDDDDDDDDDVDGMTMANE